MRRSRPRKDEASIDMTPMLDIVFILLIFFIVTATFLQEEGVNLVPPPPPDDQQQQDETNPVILIQLDDRNRVFVNQEVTSALRVMAAVSRIRAEAPNSSVLLEVANEAEHGTMVEIYDELKANGIPVLIARAKEGEET